MATTKKGDGRLTRALDEGELRRIREAVKAGVSLKAVGRRFGLGEQTIRRIARGEDMTEVHHAARID